MPSVWKGRLAGSLAFGLLIGLAGPLAAGDFGDQLARAALERTRHPVVYDGSYHAIDYPNGDVPDHIGVCTDVVIRSYRSLGIDLQRSVHEDMRRHFGDYPSRRIWGLRRPDPNIDHRRVPNLQVFLTRQGAQLPVTGNPDDYLPGDLVTWRLPGNLPHIGVVSNRWASDGRRRLMVHNIGAGPKLEDMLFAYPITDHYRYRPVNVAHPSDTAAPPPTTEAHRGDSP